MRYVDYASRDHLIEHYKNRENVDVRKIPEIDIVTGGRLIDNFVEPETLDFVVASHVAEHVPDLVGWLEANLKVLKVGGRIALAFPDRRYCFDLARQPTQLFELVSAHLEKRVKPTFQQMCDHFMNVRTVLPKAVWDGELNSETAPSVHQRDNILAMLRKFYERDDYVDVHCWKFSDAEFSETMEEIRQLFGLPFHLLSLLPTQKNSNEFYATFMKI